MFKFINLVVLTTVLSLAASCGGSSKGKSSSSSNNGPGNGPNNFRNPGQLLGPNAINLRSSGDYVILAKTAITTVPNSAITGNLGISPAALSDLEGFDDGGADASNQFITSPQVTGRIYGANSEVPTPNNLTIAVLDMQAAYEDGAGRANPDELNLMGGDISGLTLVPGLYKWTNTVLINDTVYLNGGPNDVFIFQIAGGLTMAANKSIILQGGVNPKNIFFVVAEAVEIGTGSHFEGIILGQTAAALQTGASMNGRLLMQTAVTLDQATVTKPAN